MSVIVDSELGEIKVTRNALAKSISFRITPSGTPKITLPTHAPEFAAKLFLKSNRGRIRAIMQEHSATHAYTESQQIGKSHSLIINVGSTLRVTLSGTTILATVPENTKITVPSVQAAIRTKVLQALRKEAKHYLPRRLAYIAAQHGYIFQQGKLTHSLSRWGSCSHDNTIHLNITLMNLPFELIDHVLYHELAHTVHKNHSQQFWNEVAKMDTAYKTHRQQLKHHTPYI